MSRTGDATVIICGRVYELGAAYRSGRVVRRSGGEPVPEAPRRLLGHDPAFGWPGGRVETERLERRNLSRETRLDMSGRAWAAWAREVVG